MTTNTLKLCVEGIFKQMGLDFTRESVVEASPLALAYQHPLIAGNSRHNFTEAYFYHEFVFYWFSAIELESHSNFLSKMKLLAEVDLGPQSFDVQSIVQVMREYAPLIPTTRMKEVGIIPHLPLEQFQDWYFNRIDAVKLLLNEAVVTTGVQAVPDYQPYSVGLAPRATPYHDYLGELSDGMVRALGVQDDVLFTVAFEQMLMIERRFLFGEMQETLDGGLQRLGIRY